MQGYLQQQGYNQSERTILLGRCLLGWSYRGSDYCQVIRPINKLEWAQKYIMHMDDFKNIIWTDETTVQLESHKRFCCCKDGRQPRYKPRPKQPNQSACLGWNALFKSCIFAIFVGKWLMYLLFLIWWLIFLAFCLPFKRITQSKIIESANNSKSVCKL